jgi:hypothetical protein
VVAPLQAPMTRKGCASPCRAPVMHAKTRAIRHFYFIVVGTIFSSSLQKRWIVYLRGWSDKLICALDLARAGVALVC